MTRHPIQSMQIVNDLSGELRHRFNQQDYSIREAVNTMTVGRSKMDVIRAYAFWHIAMVDRAVAGAGWLGAYAEFIDKNPGKPEHLARIHADRTVRLTQGTGNIKDAARIVTASETTRILSMFYSAFSAIHNEIWDLTRGTADDIMSGNVQNLITRRLMEWSVVVFIPAVLGSLLAGQGPEEDENKLWWATKQVMIYPLVGIPIIKDIANSIESGFDYKFSPIQKTAENAVRAWNRVMEGDLAGAIKPLAMSLSVWNKWPAGQLVNTTEAIIEGTQKGDLEFWDLTHGRQGK
jgi:hypothetical protein